MVPHLAAQPDRHQLQLDLHHAVQPEAGSYTFQVRATDDLGLTTSSANRGALTVNAQVPGDLPPDGLLNVTGTVTGGQSLNLNLAGTATDDKGVSAVRVSLFDGDTSKYVQPNGTLGAAFATRTATLASPNATSTNWTLAVALPQGGDYNVTAYAVDTVNQQDISTTGATARYRIYPGDVAPTITEALLAPTENTVFDDGRIFVSGRAEDDQAMQRAELAIVDSAGGYMSSSGTFSSTSESWRSAFLTSPGTPGSNFSYTSPVVPPGAYTIRVRGMDNHDQVTAVPSVRHVTVTHPPGNTAPVAKFTNTCPAPGQAATATNVCELDGRTSTDENAATLSYAWTYTLGASTSTTSGPSHTHLHCAGHLHGAADRDRRVGHLQRAGDEDGHDHRADQQCRTHTGAQPAVVQRPGLQLLRGRVDRQQRRGHVHLPVGLRRRHGHEHLLRSVAHLPGGRHLPGEADDDGRLGQGQHGDQVGDGHGSVAPELGTPLCCLGCPDNARNAPTAPALRTRPIRHGCGRNHHIGLRIRHGLSRWGP